MTQIRLNEREKARIIELIEQHPDAFAYCLGELAGDSVLYENAEDARRELEADHMNSARDRSTRQPGACIAAVREYHKTIDAFEAVREVAAIMNGK